MAETIQNTLTRLTQFISENYTAVETGPGSVINELLLKLATTLHNNQYNLIAELNQGNNMYAVLNTAGDTYSPVMDEIASNYNIVRASGYKVKGKIKVTVAQESDYNFRAGLTFEQSNLNLSYFTTEAIRVSSEPSAELNELQLFENQGLYYFIIDVEAADVGEQYQVSSGTIFSLGDTSYISDFVKAEAYGNFSSGKSLETDKQLVNRIKYGLSHSKLESPAGILNRFSSNFTGFQTLHVCGANDDELTRSKQNALGISTFGKADVYVRSSLGIETIQAGKSAKKIEAGLWEMNFKNYEFPGFYNVKSILPDETSISLTGTLDIVSTDFGFSLYQDASRNNDINNLAEARFTKYQTAKVLFNYEELPDLAVGEYKNFLIQLNSLPYIAEMQNLLLLDDQRLACADYLVKAVIPCMVSLEINLIKKRSTDTYTSLGLQNLKKDIFNYVNSIPFGAELQASNIVDLCHNYSIKRVDLPIQMKGIILCPDGTSLYLSDTDILSIPKRLDKSVTPNTTLYFIDYYRTVNGVTNPIDNIGLNIS
jgi:hypothetical protein